jgi:Mg-chelatase subunit ChlD
MRADDRMAIVQFSREVELLRDLTSDRTELEEGLSLLERGTGTSFYDAIHLTVSDVLAKSGSQGDHCPD